jgi:uncharacterized protein (DUF2267 family)
VQGGEGDETAVVEVVLGHGGVVTTDQEGLLRRGALEGTGLPQVVEDIFDGGSDAGPEKGRVRLEDSPLRAVLNGLLDEDEQAADVDIAVFGILVSGVRTPDANALIGDVADDVDAERV